MKKIFAVAALMISSRLLAQTVPPLREDSATTMDEVTLSANKYSVKTTETGKVVTVITRKDIEHAGSRDLSQLITELGGVFINGFSSNPGKEKNIYLRGARVDYTLITIDGVPVYDATGIGSNFDIRNISIDNVERIEILKGSQGTLYGSDAIAGVINIITRKGASRPFSLSGVTDYGSYNTWRFHTAISGKQNIFDYNLGFSHFETDGFSEAKQPAGAAIPFDKDGYHSNGIQANFGIQGGSKLRILPFFRYDKFKGSLDLDAFTDEKDFTNENKNLQSGVKSVANLGKAQLNIIYQYTNTRRQYLDDSSYVGPTAYYTYSRQQYIAHEHFAEAFVVYPLSLVKITAGADTRISNTDYSAYQKNVFSPVPETPAYSGDSIRQNQVGVYAAANFEKNGFSLEGGGRMNHHSEYGNNFAFNINPSYFIQRRVKVFANASSGYKTPSLYQLFSIYGNRSLKPETSLNLEGGVQVFTKDEQSSLRVVYFNRHIKDVIAFVFDASAPTFFRYMNQDKQDDHGFEVEANSKLFNRVQVKALYSYVTGEITTKKGGKDTTYFNLLRRPKSTFNFFLGSQLTKALYVDIQLNIVGERKDVYFDPVSFKAVDITMKHYSLLNFYAEYAFSKGRVKLFADLRNLLDQDYMDIYGYNTAKFNAYGGIRFRL